MTSKITEQQLMGWANNCEDCDEQNASYEFFWNGPFSQWYGSDFVFEGRKFNCAEQFMMVGKALVFNDHATAKSILKTSSPKEQKALGRLVKNFNVDKWAEVAQDIVYVGSWLKYQDATLQTILLKTKPKVLVEASPFDKIWGIGLAASDKRAQQQSTWQGKNWLGYILTQVRDDIEADKRNEQAINITKKIMAKL